MIHDTDGIMWSLPCTSRFDVFANARTNRDGTPDNNHWPVNWTRRTDLPAMILTRWNAGQCIIGTKWYIIGGFSKANGRLPENTVQWYLITYH